ncbi:MAG: DUF835 domain-containing protein [Methanomassiliicoccales archaeon]|nr:MAG: DUF835 domain-containing protein [Methanomassiliicoccales archaeon]
MGKVSGLDIPEGTKIKKVMAGGEKTLQIIMDLLGKKPFNGYVLVKLEIENEVITSYLLLENSEPKCGVREVLSKNEKSPEKMVRRVYAGENTIDDIKQDSYDENASIEIHSVVDIKDIIERYTKEEKGDEEGPQMDSEARKDSRRIGLFWGGKDDEESLEREVLGEKLRNWESRGYEVSGLKEILSKDYKDVKAAFDRFEGDVTILEEMAAEIEILTLAGFEKEVRNLKEKLKDPSQIPNIRAQIEAMEHEASKMETETKPEDMDRRRVCIVCGFPLNDDVKCPRCGALSVRKKAEKTGDEDIELLSGRCYLIEEEKLNRSLSFFIAMLNKGYKGFCITRTHPKYLNVKKGLKDASIVWLTDRESATEATISPSLERIIYEIGDFLKKEEKGCVVLDGIEYLVSNNSFDPVLRFIRRIIDDISEGESILLVAVGPHTLKEQELKILEREMELITYEDNT